MTIIKSIGRGLRRVGSEIYYQVFPLFLKGELLHQLWEWYIVPIFGVSQIGPAESMGLVIIATILFPKPAIDFRAQPVEVVVMREGSIYILLSVLAWLFHFLV